ncbi:MAG: PTS transporter subunit EIIB [bacterium]|nr:PTS transporter subunit EIIB [bacterium]
MNISTYIEYAVIFLALVIIALVVIKFHKKDFAKEVNKLVQYLGGKENIINAECSMSRFKVILKDVSKVNKEGITSLGATGIVEIDNQLKIIFGKDAKELKKCIDDLL